MFVVVMPHRVGRQRIGGGGAESVCANEKSGRGADDGLTLGNAGQKRDA